MPAPAINKMLHYRNKYAQTFVANERVTVASVNQSKDRCFERSDAEAWRARAVAEQMIFGYRGIWGDEPAAVCGQKPVEEGFN